MALQKQQACCSESMEKHATHVLEQDWLKRGCGISQHVIHYQIFLKQWICLNHRCWKHKLGTADMAVWPRYG